jgi:hypothetical protein
MKELLPRFMAENGEMKLIRGHVLFHRKQLLPHPKSYLHRCESKQAGHRKTKQIRKMTRVQPWAGFGRVLRSTSPFGVAQRCDWFCVRLEYKNTVANPLLLATGNISGTLLNQWTKCLTVSWGSRGFFLRDEHPVSGGVNYNDSFRDYLHDLRRS